MLNVEHPLCRLLFIHQQCAMGRRIQPCMIINYAPQVVTIPQAMGMSIPLRRVNLPLLDLWLTTVRYSEMRDD